MTITVNLSTEDLTSVLERVDDLRFGLPIACDRAVEETADLAKNEVQQTYDRYIGLYDVPVSPAKATSENLNYPDCHVDTAYGGTPHSEKVIASGKDASFVEFGAGITYNGPAGSSPHPWGTRVGALIGEYSELGHGKKRYWFAGKSRKTGYLTYGTQAAMGLYHGSELAKERFPEILKKEFDKI